MKKVLFSFTLIVLLFSATIHAQNNNNVTITTSGLSSEINYDSIINDLLDEDLFYSEEENLVALPIENETLFNDIIISPNPSNGYINFEIPATYKYIDIKLYDAQAKLILLRRMTLGTQSLSITNLPSGLYYLYISHPEFKEKKTYKILKR